MLSKIVRITILISFSVLISACGGGGGVGKTSVIPGAGGSLAISPGSLTFTADTNGAIPASQMLMASFTEPDVAGLAIGYPAGVTIPTWLTLSSTGTTSPIQINVSVNTTAFTAGSSRSTTVRIISGKADQTIISIRDVKVTYTMLPAIAPKDTDGDGFLDSIEISCLSDPQDKNSIPVDTDADGQCNPIDTDDDNDTFLDVNDAFPLDATEWLDTDSDGTGNNADTDDDNDTFPDVNDAFPLDATEWLDTDNDGIGNNADPDDDNDTFPDVNDAFPLDTTEWLDTDNDGIGNNADTDDDNDTYLDINDAFPLDASEWLDTDNDGIGNNADPNDDNDLLADIDDPVPLDASAPGYLYGANASVLTASNSLRVMLSGNTLSNADTFYIDGIEVISPVVLSSNAVELILPNVSKGSHTIQIQYAGHSYTSTTQLITADPVYYPYSVVSIGGTKVKGYFNPVNESLYVLNRGLTQVTRYQYVSGGGWQTTSLSFANLSSMAISPDFKHFYALRTDSLIEIALDTFTVGTSTPINLQLNTILSDIEFDFANNAVMVTDYQGSGSTPVYFYDAEPQSATYKNQSSSSRLYNSAIAVSGDGTSLVLGENGLSPVQPLTSYKPITEIFADVIPTAQYRNADINNDGSKILVNNLNIYNDSFSLVGQLDSAATAAVIDSDGRFIIASNTAATLSYYDTSSLVGQVLSPTITASISENVGIIREIILSKDGLTVFVLGENKTLVVPVWQITENLIGSPNTCPTAGCNGIAVATGVPAPGSTPVIPAFDTLQSPLQHVSPTYAGVGNQFEVLLTGTGFVPASVVLFGNVLATNVRYINDQELRATIPALAAGSYNVTVDGHQTGAPNFSVITQATITPDYWPIGGRSVEMIYDANNHALYSLDIVGKLLTRINLTDNTSINQSIANASDLSWCPADGFLYVATGVDFRQYNAATLQFIQVMATTTVDRLECVSENNIVLTAENQFQYYKLFNSDTSTVISSQTFASGRLYSPTVDGVSSIGDRILFGESGITTPDRVLFTPHLLSASNLADAGTYLTSSWSDDGSIGVINNSTVVNNSLSTLGTLTAPVVASVVSSDGSKIFVMPDNTTVQKIILDPANPSAFAVSATYSIPLTSDIGTVYRIEISLDGNTIFVSGGSGIVAIDVIN